jgi:hypothetical protein
MGMWRIGVAVALVSACSSGSAPSELMVRDSAGVTIVESPRPLLAETWRVDAEPLLRIGEAEGAAEYLLSSVRAATRLPDGRLVVADGGSLELRWYDAEGRFLQRAGGPGGGPGEFSDMARVWREGDGVTVCSARAARITRFDGAGALRGTQPLATEDVRPTALGALADGRLLATASRGGFSGDGVQQDSLEVLLLTSAGGARTAEIMQYDGDGALRRIVRWHRLPEPVDAALRDSVRELTRERGRATGNAAFYEETLRQMTFPEAAPVYTTLRAEDDGTLWVRRYTLATGAAPEWDVFSPQGEWLTTVRLPHGVTLLDAGPDWIAGVHRDGLEVERVVVHRLHRTTNRGG